MATNASKLTLKITESVLKDCFNVLISDLKEEIIAHLWMKNWITDKEKSRIQSSRAHYERNENLIDILSTK